MSSARAGVANRARAISATMVRISVMLILAIRITTKNLARPINGRSAASGLAYRSPNSGLIGSTDLRSVARLRRATRGLRRSRRLRRRALDLITALADVLHMLDLLVRLGVLRLLVLLRLDRLHRRLGFRRLGILRL